MALVLQSLDPATTSWLVSPDVAYKILEGYHANKVIKLTITQKEESSVGDASIKDVYILKCFGRQVDEVTGETVLVGLSRVEGYVGNVTIRKEHVTSGSVDANQVLATMSLEAVERIANMGEAISPFAFLQAEA